MDLPASNEVHLWWAFPDVPWDKEVQERQFAVLSKAEQEQQRRFVFERDRRQYLVSHALLRDVLSRYAPVPPGNWHFEVNAYGRPHISNPVEWQKLRFNLSHTEGRAVVAVAWDFDVGIDVESIRNQPDLTEIANRYFSPLEVAQLQRTPGRFFDFWTLKEAYIKARGLGLAIPLKSFSFILAEPDDPRIAFHEGCLDQPERWQFALLPREGYQVALAAAMDARPQIVERELAPRAERPKASN
jgi:4'-phosphopantetheinyl transferase